MEGLEESGSGGGLGWALTLIDALAGEYHWKEKKILKMPLSRILAYFAAICIRHGNEPAGQDYDEEELFSGADEE